MKKQYKTFNELYKSIFPQFDISESKNGILIATANLKNLDGICPVDYRSLELKIQKEKEGWTLNAKDFFFTNIIYIHREEKDYRWKDRKLVLKIVNMAKLVESCYIKEDNKGYALLKKILDIRSAEKKYKIVLGKDYLCGLELPLTKKQTAIIKRSNLEELIE